MTHDNVGVEKKSLLQLLNDKKHYALIVALGVAIIHFIGTSIMFPFFEKDITNSLVFWILITPSMAFSMALVFLSLRLNFDLSPLDNLSLFQPLYILFSSSVYGIIGGFLASKKKVWKWLGIVIIGLLFFSSCLIANMWAAASW